MNRHYGTICKMFDFFLSWVHVIYLLFSPSAKTINLIIIGEPIIRFLCINMSIVNEFTKTKVSLLKQRESYRVSNKISSFVVTNVENMGIAYH